MQIMQDAKSSSAELHSARNNSYQADNDLLELLRKISATPARLTWRSYKAKVHTNNMPAHLMSVLENPAESALKSDPSPEKKSRPANGLQETNRNTMPPHSPEKHPHPPPKNAVRTLRNGGSAPRVSKTYKGRINMRKPPNHIAITSKRDRSRFSGDRGKAAQGFVRDGTSRKDTAMP